MCMFWFQLPVDKDEIPLLGGLYVLIYYSTNMQSIIGLSENFQVNVSLFTNLNRYSLITLKYEMQQFVKGAKHSNYKYIFFLFLAKQSN